MQLVSCMGAPFPRGLNYGAALKDTIGINLENFWSAFHATEIDKFTVIQKARTLSQEYSDQLIEEIRGIARGADLEVDELLAFNLCHGVVFPDECTVMFALGDTTSSGKSLFMKNSDKIGADSLVGPDFHQYKEINIVLAIRDEEGPDIVGVAAAGSTGLKMGVSSLGIAVGANISRTRELAQRKVDTTQMRALDRTQLGREGLQEDNALEAANSVAAKIAGNPMATPGNLEFVDSTSGVIVEGSYDRLALQVLKSGVASRANSFVVMKDLNNPSDVSSYCRYSRTQQLLKENSGNLTPDLMKQFSQDHGNGPGPNSICRHGTHYTEETSLSSMVVEIDGDNPADTRFWIALGKPCHAWKTGEACFEATFSQLAQIPEGFLNGDVWKRFYTEEPYNQAAEETAAM